MFFDILVLNASQTERERLCRFGVFLVFGIDLLLWQGVLFSCSIKTFLQKKRKEEKIIFSSEMKKKKKTDSQSCNNKPWRNPVLRSVAHWR